MYVFVNAYNSYILPVIKRCHFVKGPRAKHQTMFAYLLIIINSFIL